MLLRGHTWTSRHELEAAQGTRSVTRGQGPHRQSAPLSIESVAGLDLGFHALCQRGLVNPGDAAVLGSAFMLREIELAAARLSHVHVDTSACRFFLKLPISKTDRTAVWCSRSWSCICDTGVYVLRACPYHAGVRHLDRLTSFRNSVRDLDCSYDFPLIPGAVGTTVKKDKVVETIEALAHLTGLAAVDEQGRRAFGWHLQRVSGSRWACSHGHFSKSLARWSSSIVERYVGDAILNTLSSHVRCALRFQSAVQCPASSLAAPIGADQNPSHMDSDEEAGTAASLDHIIARLQTLEAADQVRNASGVTCGCQRAQRGCPPSGWRPLESNGLADPLWFPLRRSNVRFAESLVDRGIYLCRFVPPVTLLAENKKDGRRGGTSDGLIGVRHMGRVLGNLQEKDESLRMGFRQD